MKSEFNFCEFHPNTLFSDYKLLYFHWDKISATGWIGFLWTLWLAVKKSFDVTKHSLIMTGSALSAYSAARHARHRGPEKVVD